MPYPPGRLAARWGGLFLAVTIVASRTAATSAQTSATDPAAAAAAAALAASAANAPPSIPGDLPAFAGRVDPDTYRVGPGDEFAFRASDLQDPRTIRVGPTGDILLPDAGALPVAGLTLREVEARVREALRPYVRGKGIVLTLQRPRRFRALVLGDVQRPGAVLVQAPARASDAIEAAGGVTGHGARRGILLRRDGDSLWVDLVRFERTGDLSANPLVFETDVIVVPTSARRVEVLGAVPYPNWYDLAPGDRASTLLEVAGGLLPQAAGDRLALSRGAGPGRREEFPVATSERDAPSGAGDPIVEPGDRILVPERAHWREGARVEIRGEVALPGPYGIVDGVDSLGALLVRAGGFTEWADTSVIRIERRTNVAQRDSAFVRLARDQGMLVPTGERDYLIALTRERGALSPPSIAPEDGVRPWLSWTEIPLLDGDRVFVPRQTRTVMVQGEVRAPGHVPYQPGGELRDYVAAAGGYTGRANKSRVRVTLAATGRPVNAEDVQELKAGDAVWVPAREPRNGWGTFRDILTAAAQAAAIYLVILEATR